MSRLNVPAGAGGEAAMIWTLHLAKEQQVAELLGIPATVTQAALFAVA
ncbi:hypothetical protein MLAC_18740 [Mycobacterium lacus]|uniref:Uncharacterized protein n=1 Tax=Mycobacterium lacus TaxID=169765 RepID=A0A7I7NJ36_9MYCO|nr:hypothetical protein [Mycobacterium lacus]BBX96580.1 hypothetical protein MLAC_18740 [Mycobacterium lacus]